MDSQGPANDYQVAAKTLVPASPQCSATTDPPNISEKNKKVVKQQIIGLTVQYNMVTWYNTIKLLRLLPVIVPGKRERRCEGEGRVVEVDAGWAEKTHCICVVSR